MAGKVDREYAARQRFLRTAEIFRAPQERFDARSQLFDAEGLGHIVVRAEFKAKNAVAFVTASCEQNDGEMPLGRIFPDGAAHAQAVWRRHHPIKDECVRYSLLHRVQHLVARGEIFRFKAGVLQAEGCKLSDIRFVIYNIDQGHDDHHPFDHCGRYVI